MHKFKLFKFVTTSKAILLALMPVCKKGGGSAIYIKQNIDFTTIEKIIFNDIDIEIAGIVFKSGKVFITLLAAYMATLKSWTA